MKKTAATITICLLSIGLFAQTLTGKVIAVKDGDTIEMLVDKKPVKIRLHGIDCPEKKQPFGDKAKQFTSDLCFGKIVKAQRLSKDRYGRIVAKVFLPGGGLLNLQLLKAGLAWHYTKYDRSDDFALAEKEARAQRQGIWSMKDPIAPWSWRKGVKELSK
jgi:endonuclease YncB( thermonuclease family)